MANKKKTPRINLNVPFPATRYVKSIGGVYWDRKTKVWYTYAGAYQAKYLVRFMTETDKTKYGFAKAKA